MSISIDLLESDVIGVGSFGKSVGLKGGVRVFLITDFPEILCVNARFYIPHTPTTNLLFPHNTTATSHDMINTQTKSDKTLPFYMLTLHSYNAQASVIRWNEITTRENADKLRNITFYSTINDTRKSCHLQQNEFFYFDIIGMKIVENGEILGIVQDIQKIANTYYFVIQKNFLIPYIDRYVLEINLSTQEIHTIDAKTLHISS